MELKASLLEWLLELNLPDEDLPLSEYVPQESGGVIQVSEEAELALLNGKGTWAIVSHVLKSKGVDFPRNNPLKRGRTAIDRLHNWSFIERLLSTVGLCVDPDLKALAVAGDCYAVANILSDIRAFCTGEPPKEREKDAGSLEEEDSPEQGGEQEEHRALSTDLSPESGREQDDTSVALLQAAGGKEEEEVYASVSRQAKDIYQMPKQVSQALEESDSCAQFFVRSISRHFNTENADAVRFLIDDNGILEDWIVRGRPAGKYDSTVSWLNEIIVKVTDLCFHIASEPSTLSVSLTLIATGVKSRNRQVALTTCFLLKQAIATLQKYYLWKASKAWFTSRVGALLPMVNLMKRFPDSEIAVAVSSTIRAFYKEEFPQTFLPDIHDLCRDSDERALFLRDLMYAIAEDESIENKITSDSVLMMFQYFMEQLEHVDKEYTQMTIIGAMTVCWEHFDIHPNVEIRIKKVLGYVQNQSRSEIAEIRHFSVSHFFSLFDFLLRSGEALIGTCQQSLMAFYVANYDDVFLEHAILSNLLKLLEKYDHVPLTIVVSRLTSKIMEEGKVSSLQLQVLQSISQHPNLGIGDAVSLFKFLLNLTNARGINAITCMSIVTNMLERVAEEEEAFIALSNYSDRIKGIRIRKKTRKSEFVARIEMFLKQREDFTFVSRNLDEQFKATVRYDGQEEGGYSSIHLNNKENYVSASPSSRSKEGKVLTSPNARAGLRGREAQVKIAESRYNARRGSVSEAKVRKDDKARKKAAPKDPKPKVKVAKKEVRKAPAARAQANKEISKKDMRDMKERHRREIEEIKLRRERKEEALKKKEQERLMREEYMRLKHIEKRNQIVKRRIAGPKRSGHADAENSQDSKVIQELVIEALNKRLEADPNTPMPKGFTKHVEKNYYSSMIEEFSTKEGENHGETAHLCLSLLCDLMEEKLSIPAPKNLLGTVVAKAETTEEETSSEEAKKRDAKKPAQQRKTKSVRKKPRETALAGKSKSPMTRINKRSPMYHAILDLVDEIFDKVFKKVARKRKPKGKPTPSTRAPDQPQSSKSDDRLKYWHQHKQKEALEREEAKQKKIQQEREDREKRKARSEFLKRKLEKQKQEKEERDRRMIEEAKQKQIEKEREKSRLEEAERKRRLAQKEKIQLYKETKAKELEKAKLKPQQDARKPPSSIQKNPRSKPQRKKQEQAAREKVQDKEDQDQNENQPPDQS